MFAKSRCISQYWLIIALFVLCCVGAGLLGMKFGTGSLEPNGVSPARGLQRVALIDRWIDVVTIHRNIALKQPQLVAGSGPGEWACRSVMPRSLRPNRQRSRQRQRQRQESLGYFWHYTSVVDEVRKRLSSFNATCEVCLHLATEKSNDYEEALRPKMDGLLPSLLTSTRRRTAVRS